MTRLRWEIHLYATGGHLPHGISVTCHPTHVNGPRLDHSWYSNNLPKLVKISQTTAELLRFEDLRYGGFDLEL